MNLELDAMATNNAWSFVTLLVGNILLVLSGFIKLSTTQLGQLNATKLVLLQRVYP